MADSDESKEKPTAFGKFAASVERLLKLGTALVAIIYLFGIVVLNVHLGRFGYHSLGLLQLEYIAAGVWSFAPIIMMSLLAFIGFYFYYFPTLVEDASAEDENKASGDTTTAEKNEAIPPESNDKKNNKPSAKPDKIPIFIAIFIVWIGIIALCFWAMSIEFTWIWLGLGVMGLFLLVGISLMSFAIADKSIEAKGRLIIGTVLAWLIIALPFYLVLFGRFIYPTIPDVWGGGKAAEVVLIAKDDDSKAIIESAGIQFVDAKKSVPLKSVWATEKEIVILPPQEGQAMKGIKLDKDLASIILYSK